METQHSIGEIEDRLLPVGNTLGRVEAWRGAPNSLRAFAVFTVGRAVVAPILQFTLLAIAVGVAGVALAVAIAYGLLRGLRWVWVVALVIGALNLITLAFSNGRWYEFPLGVVWIVLLVLPDARRHVADGD